MSTDKNELPSEQILDKNPERIKYQFVKSNFFRVIHFDTVSGGLAPGNDEINMSLCSQRFPIPRQKVYEFNPDGSLGKEISEERIQSDDIECEVEVSAIMSIETANMLIKWLQDMINHQKEIAE